MALHPAIRILILVVITGFMVTGNLYALSAGFVLSFVLHVAAGSELDVDILRRILRVRWFLLSIMILYAWSTPGAALLPGFGEYSPSWQGLAEGLFRCAVLIVILSLVHWLVHTTGRARLMQGIYWLVKPLSWLGFKPERLAVRLALVLETVPAVQHKLVLRTRAEDDQSPRLRHIVDHAVAIVEAVLDEADRAELIEIDLAIDQRPALRDWITLSAITVGLAVAVVLSA
jgi:energy-coupling factor transporter transmembrane protein EcfT